jgi:hypothetical protein
LDAPLKPLRQSICNECGNAASDQLRQFFRQFLVFEGVYGEECRLGIVGELVARHQRRTHHAHKVKYPRLLQGVAIRRFVGSDPDDLPPADFFGNL